MLANAVLSSLPLYHMSSILLPKGVRCLLDAKRRAFLWTGDSHCNGSQCVLSWDQVCTAKELGGLGVKNFEDANHCLLMKFLHKLLGPSLSPWKRWFLYHSSDLVSDSYLGRLVRSELPRFRSITVVKVGDGSQTSFWHDCWLLGGTLASAFPALYSHCIRPGVTVASFCSSAQVALFRPRLSVAAAAELQILRDCLAPFHLRDLPDTRFLSNTPHDVFTSRGAYQALHPVASGSTDFMFIWKMKLPSKVKFFGWLLFLGRLNTRAHLLHRIL